MINSFLIIKLKNGCEVIVSFVHYFYTGIEHGLIIQRTNLLIESCTV